MRRILIIVTRCLATLLVAVLAVLVAFSVSPIFDFSKPQPFSGPDVFNPYRALDSLSSGTGIEWKKANFHTHTRVKGPLNECDCWPDEVLRDYMDLGYDIVTFSNHNEITAHPVDSSLQVNVYEHGYGLFKYHKLVFGSEKVWYFDHILPLLTSQKQWQLDVLGRQSDFIQINHPFRTLGMSRDDMSKLTGYEIMELDSGKTDRQEYWDWALTAGHYSFGLANDDCHDSKDSEKIARRCNFLLCPSARYPDLKECLLGGCYYSMRVPDFGNGDWEIKREAGEYLPQLCDVRVSGDTVTVEFSRNVLVLEATGAERKYLGHAMDEDEISVVLDKDEPYVRFTAYFPDGVIIYTNAFARYDASKAASPYAVAPHTVNWPLTVLFNLCLLVLLAGCVCLIFRIWRIRPASK